MDMKTLINASLADGSAIAPTADFAKIEKRLESALSTAGYSWSEALEPIDAAVPMRSPKFYAWRDRQNRKTPKPRQLFVSKGTQVDYEGNIRTFTRSAKATPDMFDTKRCQLSKRQARRLRKETQREMRKELALQFKEGV